MKRHQLVFLLSFFLCYVLSFSIFAQDSIRVKKNELGINLSSMLPNLFSYSAYYIPPVEYPVQVMYKRNNGKSQAFRIGGNIGIDNEHHEPVTEGEDTKSLRTNLYLLFGTEWQKRISERWMFYSGGDLMPFYSKSSYERKIENTIRQNSKDEGYGISLKPFIGFRYNINPRLYLSTEASFEMRYSSSKNYNSREEPDGYRNINEFKKENLSLKMLPAAAVFIFYKF